MYLAYTYLGIQQSILDRALFACAFLTLPLIWLIYQFFLRLRIWITPLLAIGIIVAQAFYLQLTRAAAIGGVSEANTLFRANDEPMMMLRIFACYLVGALLAALCIKVYLAFLGKGRDDELAPGTAAIRVWIRPFHATLVVILALAARFSVGWSIPMGLLVGTALLLVYPVITTLTRSNPVPTEPVNESEERERVLKLVEDGKITADDAAELISALGQSRTRADRSPLPTGPTRPLLWTGGGLVAASFLMPWFEFHPADELRRVMGTFTQNAPGTGSASMEGMMNGTMMNGPMFNGMPNLTVQLSGADLNHGIGWIILLAAVAVALLPLVWPATPMNRQSQRGVTLALAIGGTLLLLYAVGSALRAAHFGALVAVAGYALLWVGIAREFSLGRTRQPALA